MGINSNFAKFLTQKLNGLSKNGISKSGSLTFGSLTQMNNYMSIFEKSAGNISSLNYQAILEALQSGSLSGLSNEADQSVAAIMNELMAIDDIQEATDISGDGEISAEELQALIQEMAGADGDVSNLTFADIDSYVEKMGLDLDSIAETAVNDAIKELEEAEAAEKAKEEEAAQKAEEAAEAAQSSAPASSAGSAGGASGGGGVSNADGTSVGQTKEKTTAETVEEIEQQIEDKNTEISEAEAEAEAKIEEQEKAKEEAMKAAGVSEEEYEQYKEKEQELENKISEKEEAIADKDNEITDKNSTISSNESYISSLEAQIEANNSKRVSSDEEGAADKNADIESKNKALEKEKSNIEEENEQLKKDVAKAEEDKQQLETEKQNLEAQKEQLIENTLGDSKGFNSGKTGTEKTELTNQIKEFDKNISDIRAEKDQKVSGLRTEIQDLQVQLKEAQAKEDRTKILKDNTFNQGLGLSGEELAEVAEQMLAKYGSSTGYCATGVSRTFAMAYGLNLHGNGCDWDSNMDQLVEQGAFEEITGDYASAADLKNLPAGAVICWENTGGTSGGGAQYGHVTITDGKGGEISDHHSDHIYTHLKQYRVFYPVS